MTESNLIAEVSLAEAIEKYKTNNYFSKGNQAKFLAIVNRIVNEQPDLNVWNEEEIGFAFGCNKYEEQRLILDLAYYEAGRILSKDSCQATLENFQKWEDCTMMHGFFLGYEISKDILAHLLTSLEGTIEKILLQSRCFHQEKEDLIKFCYTELANDKTDDSIIELINCYNNGEYTELPLYISALGYFIVRDEHYDLYIQLMECLIYFPLQGSLLYFLHTVEDCIKIQKLIEGKELKRKKVLLYLLRERLFQLMHEQPDFLERNAKNEYLKDSDVPKRAEAMLKSWDENISAYAAKAVNIWIKQFGYDELTEWLSRKQVQMSYKNLKICKKEISIVDILNKEIYSHCSLPELSIDDKSLDTLYNYVLKSVGTDYGPKYYGFLIETICQQIYAERYLKPFSLNDETFDLLRALYFCLEKSSLDGVELMKRYRIPDEGFLCDESKNKLPYAADTVWLSVLVLQTETIEDVNIFRERIDILFRFSRISSPHMPDYYFLPFYIAEMVATQVHKSVKDDFEGRLIVSISNIAFVLRVLSANEGELSEKNKAALKLRVDAEWQLEQKISRELDNKQRSFLNEFLENLFKEVS